METGEPSHIYRSFNSEMREKLDQLLDCSKLSEDDQSIRNVSHFILSSIHFSEAPNVIKHITKQHFGQENELAGLDRESDQKKYLLFFVAHELIFKSREFSKGRQVLESILADGSKSRQELEVDSLAYIRAIGDNLQQWITHFCLVQGETDYYRLNVVVNLLDLWDSHFIFQKTFTDTLRLFIMPSHEQAKAKFLANQCL
jgi:hypothetical protein